MLDSLPASPCTPPPEKPSQVSSYGTRSVLPGSPSKQGDLQGRTITIHLLHFADFYGLTEDFSKMVTAINQFKETHQDEATRVFVTCGGDVLFDNAVAVLEPLLFNVTDQSLEAGQDEASAKIGSLWYHLKDAPLVPNELAALEKGKEKEGESSSISTDLKEGLPVRAPLYGEHRLDLLKKAHVDVACVGNHDFDFGPETMRTLANRSKFPWLASNITETSQPYLNASHVEEFNGVKVGFFSIVTKESQDYGKAGNTLTFAEEPVECAKAQVEHLREQGCQVICALTHVRDPIDEAIQKDVPGIDFILGGHTHNHLTKGPKRGAPANTAHIAKPLSDCLEIIQATVTVKLPDNGASPLLTRKITTIDPSAKEADPESEKLRCDLHHLFEKALNQPIIRTPLELTASPTLLRKDPTSEFGNLIADCALASYPEADAAMLFSGIIHESTDEAGLSKKVQVKAGNGITSSDLFHSLLDRNYLVPVRLKGNHILTVLKRYLGEFFDSRGEARYPILANMKATYITKPDAEASAIIEINGKPIVERDFYTIVFDNFGWENSHGLSKEVSESGELQIKDEQWNDNNIILAKVLAELKKMATTSNTIETTSPRIILNPQKKSPSLDSEAARSPKSPTFLTI